MKHFYQKLYKFYSSQIWIFSTKIECKKNICFLCCGINLIFIDNFTLYMYILRCLISYRSFFPLDCWSAYWSSITSSVLRPPVIFCSFIISFFWLSVFHILEDNLIYFSYNFKQLCYIWILPSLVWLKKHKNILWNWS